MKGSPRLLSECSCLWGGVLLSLQGISLPPCSDPSPVCPLQVVLSEQQSPEDGERVARRLMEELGVQEEDLVAGAYLDLLLAGGSPT